VNQLCWSLMALANDVFDAAGFGYAGGATADHAH
jgi:hypothetical protein